MEGVHLIRVRDGVANRSDHAAAGRDPGLSAGELADLLREPTFQEQFDQVGRQLLLTLGLELTRRRCRGRALS